VWIRTKYDTSSVEGLTYSYFVGKTDNYFLNDSVSFLGLKTNGIKIINNQLIIDTTKITLSAISGGFNDGNTAVISKNGIIIFPKYFARISCLYL